jgi:quaternary ammonium compound-resistance protein SugE
MQGLAQGWGYLALGIVLAGFSMPLAKMAHGFDKLYFAIPSTLLYWGANLCWIMSMKHIPLSTAYLVWLGFDAVIMILLSYFMFHETFGLQKCFFMMMILIGCIGLTIAEK